MKIREIASGLRFPEGPVWMDDGSILLVEVAAGMASRSRPMACCAGASTSRTTCPPTSVSAAPACARCT